MMPLPKIMVAPNGAYKTKADHPNIPVTLAETVAAVVQAHAAGATGAHVHIRNDDQSHLLDAVQYRMLIDDITARCPDFYVQITTEAAGKYTSQFQRDLILDVAHPYVSAAIVELLRDCSRDDLATFYAKCTAQGIVIQHIFYSPDDMHLFYDLVRGGVIPAQQNGFLFVLGRYTTGQKSDPQDLDPFLECLDADVVANADWAVCAFGARETACVVYAIERGGKARIGFENNLLMENGEIAQSNTDRVYELCDRLNALA